MEHDDPVLWNLLDRAAALPLDQRKAFLDAACAGDPERRAQVEAVLAGAGGGKKPEPCAGGRTNVPDFPLSSGDGGRPPRTRVRYSGMSSSDSGVPCASSRTAFTARPPARPSPRVRDRRRP